MSFYVIKHLPTGTYIPAIPGKKMLSYYYLFLDGYPIPSPTRFSPEHLILTNAFRYFKESDAQKWIDITYPKLRKNKLPKEQTFAVEIYDSLPLKYIKPLVAPQSPWARPLHLKHNNPYNPYAAQQGMRSVNTLHYCMLCRIYIPPELGCFQFNNGTKICMFCMEEIGKTAIDKMKDLRENQKNIVDVLENERFVSRL